MKLKSVSLALALVSSSLLSACYVETYSPSYYYDCYYDYWGFYVCDTYYYNGDGTQETSRDMVTDIAQTEAQLLKAQAKHYASKFSLSEEQGAKIAKTVSDFNAIKDRSEKDLADFAQRLYGVNPSSIVSAVGAAQVGYNAQLNSLVNEAAKNFNTTSDNMKSIVKSLHGKMLESQGIRF